MDKLILYAIEHKSSKMLSNYMFSTDDKNASTYFLEQTQILYNELAIDDKKMFSAMVKDSYFVRVGTIDPLTHDMSTDYNVLLDLKDLEFKEVTDNVQN